MIIKIRQKSRVLFQGLLSFGKISLLLKEHGVYYGLLKIVMILK
ncbi:hypothetical protein [Bacillus mesophilum]|nr:hypothetical protein [Bacillus mesophilum]